MESTACVSSVANLERVSILQRPHIPSSINRMSFSGQYGFRMDLMKLPNFQNERNLIWSLHRSERGVGKGLVFTRVNSSLEMSSTFFRRSDGNRSIRNSSRTDFVSRIHIVAASADSSIRAEESDCSERRNGFRYNNFAAQEMEINRKAGDEGQDEELFGRYMAKVHLLGVMTMLAFGIGAGAATASVLGLKPTRRNPIPCFASVSTVLDENPTLEDKGAEVSGVTPGDSADHGQSQEESRGKGNAGGLQSGDLKVEEDKQSLGSDSAKGERDLREGKSGEGEEDDDDDDDGTEDEDDEEEENEDSDDEEGENEDSDEDHGREGYPTVEDMESFDELGELGSGAAAAERLSGSGEIESAETGGEMGLGPSSEEVDAEEEDLDEVYEEWRSKPYALTVPLRIVSLRGSVPPAWLKDFLLTQGKNAKLAVEFRGSLSDILADLAVSMEKRHLTARSAMAADLVTVGDSWLATAVQGGLIEPIANADQFEWFKRLDLKWQNFLRRDPEGIVNPEGPVWGIPYRWGSLVIAYRRDKLEKNGVGPIKDWMDLWKPELAGRVAMVDSPREVVGAVLKSLGASYNTRDFDTEIPGGREAVKERFVSLQKQVRLFDDVDYLKAMGAGDVWVAVGWSSDVIPFAKRTSNVAVIAPESGTSLWADLWVCLRKKHHVRRGSYAERRFWWKFFEDVQLIGDVFEEGAIPATTTFTKAENVGGRVHGPSPLVFQWLDFCLQPARAITFQNDVFVGASPLYLSERSASNSTETPTQSGNKLEQVKDQDSSSPGEKRAAHAGGKIETNIVEGMPPQEIVAKSEFLEPLSEKAMADYQWLLSDTVDVQGWPSGIIEFIKSNYQGSLQWARSRGIRT